ncbi:phosphatase PAP2 family protein [Curtobacterium sp. RRHDQ10]|uniref:phosphatase PAP2 family protein n=1 Tax=Curtobacterium phyllosphaerae TaxID=3413379 RepID=UPI003BF43D80
MTDPDRTGADQTGADQTGTDSDAVRRRSIGGRDVTEWRSRGGRRLARAHRELAARVGPRRAVLGPLAVGGVLAVAATAAAAVVYDGVTDRDGIARLDQPALRIGKRLRSPATNGIASGIAHGFGPVGMPVLALVAGTALSLVERRPTPLGLLAAAGGGSLAMTIAGKRLIHRNRPPRRDAIPPYETSPSFPSGHTLNATTIAGTVAYLLMLRQRQVAPQRVIAAVAGVTIAATGASRVLLGAHWFTDVTMGWVSGSGWLASVITAHRLHLTLEEHSGPRHRSSSIVDDNHSQKG